MNNELYELRVRVSDLICENAYLKRENQRLKDKIDFFQASLLDCSFDDYWEDD